MKKKNLRLNELAVKSFVTNQKETEQMTIKGGGSFVICPDSANPAGPCNSRYCTIPGIDTACY